MTVLIGTSGFSYKDWVGPVYPDDLPKSEWLGHYAGEFATCELNFSYYRIPNASTLANGSQGGRRFSLHGQGLPGHHPRAAGTGASDEAVHAGAGPADR